MILALIGYRGSGKTTIGRLLAERLQLPLVDTDELIVARAGKTIREIFAQDGEITFRDFESQVVADVCRKGNRVISFGGGAMDREINRQVAAEADIRIVYLRCEPAELLRRIRSDPLTAANRPNLTALAGGIDEINVVLARREPIWRKICRAEVEVGGRTPEEIAEEIIRHLPTFETSTRP